VPTKRKLRSASGDSRPRYGLPLDIDDFAAGLGRRADRARNGGTRELVSNSKGQILAHFELLRLCEARTRHIAFSLRSERPPSPQTRLESTLSSNSAARNQGQ